MDFTKGKVNGLSIAYLGGGSRAWAWKLMADLALEESLSGTVKLYDLNQTAAKENECFGNQLTARPDVKGKWHYQAVATIKEALQGADFVIISILPGTFEEMRSDVHLPEQYGIYQSVGDTVGPGGLMRALRTIPIYEEFARDIREYAPKAWVINYTNPMTLCTRVLYEVFPEIKAFGCCHEVFNTQNLLAAMLEERCGIAGVKREEIKTNVLGINHFTWFDRAYYQNIDLFPIYSEFAHSYFEEGFLIPGTKSWLEDPFKYAQRVKFDLFLRYGLIAAAGDRHLAEFVPQWYLKNPEMVREWKFNLTTLDYRENKFETLSQERRRVIAGEADSPLNPSGEEGVKQIMALVGLGELVTNINYPNRGQMLGIPGGAVVETNALLTADGVTPVLAGGLPVDIQALVIRHVYNQETILKAALTQDKELAFNAFINDPMVTIDRARARELFEQMLGNTERYLPGWKI